MLSQSMTRSISFSMSPSRGLQECPVSGAITEGISEGLYLCLLLSGASQTSQTDFKPRSRVILLLYTFFGRGIDVCLNLLGSRGARVLSLSSDTTSGTLNFYLISASWSWARASSNPEMSMFLAHFFLFCLPFKPFTFTSQAISTLRKLTIILYRRLPKVQIFLSDMRSYNPF